MTTGPYHELVITLVDYADVRLSVACPHTGTDRPCASWRATEVGETCICTCEACVDGAPGDCESDYIEDIGHKWCDARPLDECWYQDAVAHADWRDMLTFSRAGVQARIPVRLHGGSWEEPIEVEAVTTQEVTG